LANDSKESLHPTSIQVQGAGGLTINVWDHGGDGPPLILAHCTGTHARIWDPLVEVLQTDFHLYAVDTRAHGESHHPDSDEGFAWNLSGEDLLCVVDALSLGPGLLAAGHSAGAAHICYAELQRPGAFAKAVLIDPVIAPPGAYPKSTPLVESARRRKNSFDTLAEAESRFASKSPMNTWDPVVRTAYLNHAFNPTADGSITLKCPGPTEAKFYERGGSTDIFDRLGEIQAEVLLVTAEHSNLRPFVTLQNAQFSGHTFHEIQNTSHFIPQEQPLETATLIRDFLL